MEETLNFNNVALYRAIAHGIRRIDCKALVLKINKDKDQTSIAYQYLEKRKRYPRGNQLTGDDLWLRVVPLANAIDPDFFLVADGPDLLRSRYLSYDVRYMTDFEDKITAANLPVLFSVGAGHRGECPCHSCSHRLKDISAS
jgi:hypothetical protein